MANTNCNIDNGTPPTMSCGQVTLNYNDTLTLGIGTGFTNPTTTSITQVNFYNSVNGGKGPTLKGQWKRQGTYTLPTGISAATSGSGVIFTDTDSGNVDEDYYYNVIATDSTTHGNFTADPELVVRKRVRPPAARAPRPDIAPDA